MATTLDEQCFDNSTSDSINEVLDCNSISQFNNISGSNITEKVDHYNDNTNQAVPHHNNGGTFQYGNNGNLPDENALMMAGQHVSNLNFNQAMPHQGRGDTNFHAETYNQTSEENYTKGDDVHLNQTGEPYHFQGTWPKVVPADSSVIDHSKKEEKIENVSNDNKSEKSEEKNTENVEKNLKEKGKTETIKGVKKETDEPPLAPFILGSLTTSFFWLIGLAICKSH